MLHFAGPVEFSVDVAPESSEMVNHFDLHKVIVIAIEFFEIRYFYVLYLGLEPLKAFVKLSVEAFLAHFAEDLQVVVCDGFE